MLLPKAIDTRVFRRSVHGAAKGVVRDHTYSGILHNQVETLFDTFSARFLHMQMRVGVNDQRKPYEPGAAGTL